MAAPAPSPAATAASSSSSSASAATIGPPECPICTEAFECDEAADPAACHLPRTLPCAHSVCSACLIKLLTATPGRVFCPTCRADHVLQRPLGLPFVAAYVRLIPQNADIVQLIRRSAQLEATLQEQQWVQVQQQQGQSLQPHCAIGPDCAKQAVRWCDDCDAAWCVAHDIAIHGLALVSHLRVTISEKETARQAKVASALAAAGISLKASAAITVQQQKKEVERLEAEEDELRRAVDEKKRQLDESRAQLAAVQVSAARLNGLSDIEAQRQSDSFFGLIHFPPGASGLLASLSGKQLSHLCRFLGSNRMPTVRLLYRATRDGFTAVDFWRCCAGKGPTLTLVQVAHNGFICGAYTPVSWPADAATHEGHVSDPSGRTFLFSLANAHGRPVKLRLQEAHRDKVLNMRGSGFGPGFGSGADLRFMRNANSANHMEGCVNRQKSFELDHEGEAAAGLPSIPFAYDKTLLAGDDGKGLHTVCFAAAEIEVYQL